MENRIGENIKRLRNQKGITQDALAEHMHVSGAAVSKWERGETFPAMSLIVPLAMYFDVSTDEIFGLDKAENERKIKNYLDEYRRLGCSGKIHEKFELMMKAYEEFPNDWRIIEEYMGQLNNDPNCTEHYGNEVHKEELYRLCDRVLDECTLDSPRYSALSILSGLYIVDGNLPKAIEIANRFPPAYLTRGEELENCYERGSEEWWKQSRENIWNLMDDLQVKIRNAGLYAPNPAEQIRILKKAVSLIELIYDDGDYGFSHYSLGELYLWIANRYVMIDDFASAFEYYEKALAHSKIYDNLPKTITHTSFLIRGKIMDMSQTTSTSNDNQIAIKLDYIRSCECYEKVKDMPQMQAIIAKYEPFVGKKKDYGN